MGHGHHHGESVRDYFTEQLLTILVCGLFGFAAIQLHRNNMLGFLAEPFRNPVLYGGIGVLVLVALRSIAIWKEAGQLQADANGMTCGVDHIHGPDCDHDLGIGATADGSALPPAEHEHSHDLSWVFARMMILVFPAALYFLGLPSASLSQDYLLNMVGSDSALDAKSLKDLAEAEGTTLVEEKTQPDGTKIRTLKTKSGGKIRVTVPKTGDPVYALVTGDAVGMSFNDLNDAAFNEPKRESLSGQTIKIEGRFKRIADKEFTLFRMKMTCCASDTVPLKVRIVVPQALSGYADYDWVEVKGQLQFFKVQDSRGTQYVPAIMVGDITDVKKTPAKSEYE